MGTINIDSSKIVRNDKRPGKKLKKAFEDDLDSLSRQDVSDGTQQEEATETEVIPMFLIS